MAAKTFLNAALTISLFLVVLSASATAFAKTIYVDPNGSSDFTGIQEAIDDANDGDEIEVAPGIYYESIDFKGKAVWLYSSAGPEVTKIDGTGYYHVVECVSGEDSNTVLEDFTITGGNANGYSWRNNCGGGIYNYTGSPTVRGCIFSHNSATNQGGGMFNRFSSLTVEDCTFSENSAKSGGGMANFQSRPNVSSCTFRDNSSTSRGGGMYNVDNNTGPTVEECTFSGNSAEYGGGVVNYSSNSILKGCTFINNSVTKRGGGMYSIGVDRSPTVTNCIFTENSAGYGGGMCNSGRSTVIYCEFSGNLAVGGGGMYNGQGSSPMVVCCTFNGNSATSGPGGGMYNFFNSPSVTGCVFIANSATDGGGMFNDLSSPVIESTSFTNNSAVYNGGGIFNDESSATLTNCIFKINSARGGGGIKNAKSDTTVYSCVFSGNSANSGGGISNTYNIPTVSNCIFNGNRARYFGGAMCNSFSNPIVTNCIFWADIPSEVYGGTPILIFSDVQGGWIGEGNIDDDPLFVDLGYWDANGTPEDANDDFWVDGDYHLLLDSPCIDAGDPNYIAGPNETDLDGNPRIVDGDGDGVPIVDMGAYEYSPPISAAVRIVPRTINLQSRGKWIAAFIRLPEDYNVIDIDPNRIFLEDKIQPDEFSVDEQQQVATARFNRKDVQVILDIGEVELTITGQLNDAAYFEATDTIKVIDKSAKN